MAEFVTVVVVAFVAQLAVLPGEKVQFIIAALSARYHPLGVVAAASAAFAGWTALEIWFGAMLQGALPPLVLEAVTAVLFLLFAVMLARSAPESGRDVSTAADGGVIGDGVRIPLLDRTVPPVVGGYVPIFVLMAVGEFGDKTQLVTIGLAADYGATPAIWIGEMLAIVPVSLANAYFFDRFAHRVDLRTAHVAAAALFAFFGADAVLAMTTGVSVWEAIVEAVSGFLLGLA